MQGMHEHSCGIAAAAAAAAVVLLLSVPRKHSSPSATLIAPPNCLHAIVLQLQKNLEYNTPCLGADVLLMA